jgi:hypothetical protein
MVKLEVKFEVFAQNVAWWMGTLGSEGSPATNESLSRAIRTADPGSRKMLAASQSGAIKKDDKSKSE